MLKRLPLVFLSVAASPALAHEHDHTCLEHHWVNGAYYHELYWQFVAFGTAALILGGVKMVGMLKRRITR